MSSPTGTEAPRRSRLRRWRTLIYVIAGLALLDLVVAANRDTWERYSPDDYAERLQTCRSEPRDVIVVGGSPVSEGIDPRHFVGLSWNGEPIESVYAMGLSGGTTSESWHAVKHGSQVPPRLLIYGTTASDLNDARQEPHGPHSLMTWSDWWEWAESRPKSREWVTRHFVRARLSNAWQLYRHRHGIRMWIADSAEDLVPGTCTTAAEEARENLAYTQAIRTGNGYAPNVNFVDRSLRELKSAGSSEVESFHFLEKYRLGEHLGYLNKMLDWAEANGTDVILVDMPVAAELEEQMYPSEFQQFREALADLEQSRGVRVLRASRQAVQLREDDFSDLIHLNGTGAAKLSRWLRAELQRLPQGRSADGLLQ